MRAKAKLIVIHNDKLLLLKPLKREKYSLIGGNVDKGETPIEAAIREAKEEAGLKLKKKQLEFFYGCMNIIDKKKVANYYYLLLDKDVDYKHREKHKFESIGWVKKNEALSMLKGIEKKVVTKLITKSEKFILSKKKKKSLY